MALSFEEAKERVERAYEVVDLTLERLELDAHVIVGFQDLTSREIFDRVHVPNDTGSDAFVEIVTQYALITSKKKYLNDLEGRLFSSRVVKDYFCIVGGKDLEEPLRAVLVELFLFYLSVHEFQILTRKNWEVSVPDNCVELLCFRSDWLLNSLSRASGCKPRFSFGGGKSIKVSGFEFAIYPGGRTFRD